MASPFMLLDHTVFKPPEELRVVAKDIEEAGKAWPVSARAHGGTTRGATRCRPAPPRVHATTRVHPLGAADVL